MNELLNVMINHEIVRAERSMDERKRRGRPVRRKRNRK